MCQSIFALLLFVIALAFKGGIALNILTAAFTLTQIKQATENFKTTIGIGGFGEVYYGKLVNGQEIAVKTLSTTSHQTEQEFFNEIELLSMVHHKYLVSLVGYCLNQKHLMLVYEYMSGGDSRKRLHGDGVSRRPLSWKQRTRIILQVAEGTLYTSPNPIISDYIMEIQSNR
ncbi:unnamed protein product [Sphagnum troendelagicum]|uniref:Protein kinase domain-containing protein n=1 Tax=Sphagnum troendelagicum TaxID=128251 RepID=A0ABP0UDR4_9BRYO